MTPMWWGLRWYSSAFDRTVRMALCVIERDQIVIARRMAIADDEGVDVVGVEKECDFLSLGAVVRWVYPPPGKMTTAGPGVDVPVAR